MSTATVTVTADESDWLNGCAIRLRAIHADAVSLTSDRRREYLQEELQRALKETPPANRQRYLQALLHRFPVAGQVGTAAPTAPVAPTPPPVPQSAAELLALFLAAAARETEDRRREFSRQLQAAGLVVVDRDALVIEVAEELRKTLELKPGEEISLSRVVALACLVTDSLSKLEQASLNALRELCPRRSLPKSAADFRTLAAHFLTSELESVEPRVRDIQALLGGIVAAALGGGRDFGRELIERLSPAAIEQVVRDEGKSSGILGMGSRPKELCWEKYCDLADDYATAELVDRKVKDCLGRFIEKKVLGGR